MTTNRTSGNDRMLMIVLGIVTIDFMIKLWVLFNLERMEHGPGIDALGIIKVYGYSYSRGVDLSTFHIIALIIRLMWVTFFAFLFIRARNTAAPFLLRLGTTIGFVSIAATQVDTYLFPYLDPSIEPRIAYRQLDEFYFYIGDFSLVQSITAILVKAGLIITIIGAALSFRAFRKLFQWKLL